MLRIMLRPTRRPCGRGGAAVSRICWTRWTWLAKQAITMRRRAASEDVLEGPADLDLGDDEAWLVGVGGVRQEQVDALRGQPGQPPRSVGRPSIGVRSILKSPVCTIVPPGVRRATAMPSGIECDTA